MALKALMLSRRIEDKKKELVRLREKDQEFETREKELETAIGEAVTDEEKQTVSEEVETFDTERLPMMRQSLRWKPRLRVWSRSLQK